MSETRSTAPTWSATAVRLAALWLATGALFKLFAGTPKMLPELVRDLSPFDWTLTFQLAIGIELAVVCIAVLKPHWGWMWITAVFGFFLVLLVDMLMKGADSCGCLGEKVSMPPAAMLAIDGTLLGLVLVLKPWKNLAPPGLSTALLVVGLVVSLAVPFLIVRPKEAALPPVSNGGPTGVPTDPTAVPKDVYIQLSPDRWKGQLIYDIAEFTRVVPADKIPSDGRIVLWRQGCSHCAKHLRDMADEKNVTAPILLVQVMDDLADGRAVDALPSGDHVTQVQLPPGQGMFTTPLEIRVEGGLVTAVLDEEAYEAERAAK